MGEEKRASLNRLLATFPAGSVLPTRWLTRHGYADNLLPKYVAAGWLASGGRGVYVRTGAAATWAEAVHALQHLLGLPLHVGGVSSLHLRGLTHFLRLGTRSVTLYGPRRPPAWLATTVPDTVFEWRSHRLFEFRAEATAAQQGLIDHRPPEERHELTFAGEERAVLELLDETPARASLHEADAIVAALARLRPTRLQTLLEHCTSYKVKRLFLALAHRHRPPWLGRLDLGRIDLGRGKRALVPGGKLDRRFLITLPADLDAEGG